MDKPNLKKMEEQFEILTECLAELEVEAQVVPADDTFMLPSLAVPLDTGVDGYERVMVINYVPLDASLDLIEYTDFIQIYMELPYDLSRVPDDALMTGLDALNRKLPVGQCFTLAPKPGQPYAKMAGMRCMFPSRKGEDVDESVFIETLLLFDLSGDAVAQEFAEWMS